MVATREGREKRHLIDLSWAVKLFARLTELSWSDVGDTLREQSPVYTRAKITEYRDTAFCSAQHKPDHWIFAETGLHGCKQVR